MEKDTRPLSFEKAWKELMVRLVYSKNYDALWEMKELDDRITEPPFYPKGVDLSVFDWIDFKDEEKD